MRIKLANTSDHSKEWVANVECYMSSLDCLWLQHIRGVLDKLFHVHHLVYHTHKNH